MFQNDHKYLNIVNHKNFFQYYTYFKVLYQMQLCVTKFIPQNNF